MDSGNSGSLQSSSGGDDDFDSRGGAAGADSSPLSALLRPSPSHSAAAAFQLHSSFYGLQELTPALSQQQQATHWSAPFPAARAGASSSPSVVPAAAATSAPPSDQLDSAQASAPAQPPRGSRKRSRASRRAPTTVLTTDTSNFRAMVQEFTGVPSAPFAAGSASLRTRFDHLFPSPSSRRPAAAADSTSLPPYLLRPFAQKLQPSLFAPFASSSSSSPSSSNIGIANATMGSTAPATAPSASPSTTAAGGENYLPLTPSALLGMQDPSNYLTFQNPLGSHLIAGAGAGATASSGGTAKYTTHAMFGAAGGFASSSRVQEPTELLGGSSMGLAHGLMGSEGLHLHPRNHGHGGDELSGVVGGASGSGGCKMNYSPDAGRAALSAADLNAEKAPASAAMTTAASAAATRGEGLDSWICTSE